MPNYKVILIAILSGLTYGLSTRFLWDNGFFKLIGEVGDLSQSLMSFAFLFLVPLVMGFITGYLSKRTSIFYFIFAPWITVTLLIIATFIFALEGLICIAMALPIFLFMASLGGVIAYLILKFVDNKINSIVLCSFILIPFLAIPIESNVDKSTEIIEIHNSIEINSSRDEVWDNIVRVYEIKEGENENSLFLMMGFPRPIKAELDREEIGGVRKAIFDRGLYFTETVTEWEPKKSFTFTIEADPNSIPPEALDEHVTVGGEYFDVLEGKYEIQETGSGVALHLTSKFRMSTTFNFYTRVWCKMIMGDIQNNILNVIKKRCE